jgi:hypothetical protein
MSCHQQARPQTGGRDRAAEAGDSPNEEPEDRFSPFLLYQLMLDQWIETWTWLAPGFEPKGIEALSRQFTTGSAAWRI